MNPAWFPSGADQSPANGGAFQTGKFSMLTEI